MLGTIKTLLEGEPTVYEKPEKINKMWNVIEIMCPYCGEFQQTDVDISAGSQDYWQDCQVCCCPILFELSVDASHQFRVNVRRDDE